MLATPPPSPYDVRFGLFGFGVRVSWTFWLGASLIGFQLVRSIHDGLSRANQSPGMLVLLLLWLAAIFFSILIHELGHAFAYRRYGIGCDVVLYHFGGLAIPTGRLSSRRSGVAADTLDDRGQFAQTYDDGYRNTTDDYDDYSGGYNDSYRDNSKDSYNDRFESQNDSGGGGIMRGFGGMTGFGGGRRRRSPVQTMGPIQDIIVSAAGPAAQLASVVAAIVAVVAAGASVPGIGLLPDPIADWIPAGNNALPPLAFAIAIFYILPGLFWVFLNLVPIEPLDGGRICGGIVSLFGGDARVTTSIGLFSGAAVAIYAYGHGQPFVALMFGYLVLMNFQRLGRLG